MGFKGEYIAISQIDCEHNHLTKNKQYKIIDIYHEEDDDYFVYIDDDGNNNCISSGLFDIFHEN